MKSSVLLLAIAAVALGSCSTVYKTGQTPDDVYYSPARETEEYVEVKKDQYRSRGYEYDNPEDRYLRMKVRNPYRWNSFDDYYYNDWAYSSPYGYSSYNPFFTWNTYYSWNNYYNPYCRNIVVVNPKASPTVYSKVRNFSMGSYTTNNPKPAFSKTAGVRPTSRYNNSNSSYNNSNNNSLGTSIRKVFSGGNSNSNSGSGSSYNSSSSNDRPTRTYNPSSTSSSSSSSGSSGSSGGSRSGGSSGGSSGGGVSRPGRGG